MRFFNTAGPINPHKHYYVPHRLDEIASLQLINQEKYFILHAPRQSGKTTAINVFTEQLNTSGDFNALYINVEPAQTARNNVEKGLFTILNIIKTRTQKAFPESSVLAFFNKITAAEISGNSLYECLEFLSSSMDKPLILFIDEIDIWLEKIDYKESGPHLLLMAFLQRIINGGGKINREYALGRKKVDLLIEFHDQRIVIELKIKRGIKTIDKGLVQTAEYMDINNATEGHLVVFDRDSNKSWNEKIFTKKEIFDNHTITVWGM